MSINEYLKVSRRVADALSNNKPVVALESTIITHGMPYPLNIETALEVEKLVETEGAVPATIAVIGGKIQIGLSHDEIRQLGASDAQVSKLSRRDLAYALAFNKNGSTTVAATLICAELAGIKVFATGGIGGVHRGGENTLDVSADLQELAKTNIAVVCSGAKAILDIARTLEVLETLGVPVVGYQTERFPAFYYPDSGFGVDCTLNTPAEIAKLIVTKREIGLAGGVLIAQPPPMAEALSKAEVESAISHALLEAESLGVSGKNITPFLLKKVAERTGGSSLKCNIALIKKNAQTAAKVACALS